MTISEIFHRYNLELANSFIHDDVPTYAFEVDPNDEVFNLKITK